MRDILPENNRNEDIDEGADIGHEETVSDVGQITTPHRQLVAKCANIPHNF